MNASHLLSLIVFVPLAGVLGVLGVLALELPAARRDHFVRLVAVAASGVPLLLGIWLWSTFDGAISTVQHVERVSWIGSLGIEYFVGVDGLNVALVILTTLIGFVATLASMPWWRGKGEHDDPAHPHFSGLRVPGYFAMLLLLQMGMSGTFVALDAFLFFVFFELMLLPMYFLIGIWGGARKEYAAIKFFLYTLVGSVFLLLAIIALYWQTGNGALFEHTPSPELMKLASDGVVSQGLDGTWGYRISDGTFSARTFDLTRWRALGRAGFFSHAGQFLFDAPFTTVIWAFLFLGFAVKVPVVPLHTWLPDAHVEAPTPVSVILAGVLLKMGVYGMLRFNVAILPETTRQLSGIVAALGVVSVLYGAMVCLAQRDLKKMIAYSSISHLGFSILGIAAMTPAALSGSLFNLFTHGLISSMLFVIVGVLYDRAHHRDIDGFGGLATVMPEYTGVMGVAFFASLGLPGLAGFVPEFLVLTGSFGTLPWHTALCALGAVLTAAYYLWALQRVFLGKLNDRYTAMADLNWRERFTLYPLAALIIVLGVYPNAVLRLIDHALLRLVGPG
jgi:NADH-quinone oxidoreductase subunit M